MTNRAYVKNNGDGLLCSILWFNPPSNQIFTINTSQTVYFFNQLNHIIFFENMTTEITSSIPHGDKKFSPDHGMFLQIFQLKVLKIKFMCGYIEKLSEFNVV